MYHLFTDMIIVKFTSYCNIKVIMYRLNKNSTYRKFVLNIYVVGQFAKVIDYFLRKHPINDQNRINILYAHLVFERPSFRCSIVSQPVTVLRTVFNKSEQCM